MKLKLLMCHHRKTSVRDKVIGEKAGLFREKHSTESAGHLRRRESPALAGGLFTTEPARKPKKKRLYSSKK